MIVLQLDSNLNGMNYAILDKFSTTGLTVLEKEACNVFYILSYLFHFIG